MSAALSLQKFVYEIPRKNADNSSSGEISPEDFDVKEVITEMIIAFLMIFRSLNTSTNRPLSKMRPKHSE